MPTWITAHQTLLTWLTFGSLAAFVISLLALPWLVARIPTDYFLYTKRHPIPLKQQHPIIRMVLLIGKNILGAILLIGGILMIFIPGQGLLTIAMGMLLLDYPGKFLLERKFVRQAKVLNTLNWLRAKTNAPPLEIDIKIDTKIDTK